jgi:hypothetical protein
LEVGVLLGVWARAEWLPSNRNADSDIILNSSRRKGLDITPKTPSHILNILLKTKSIVSKQVSFDQVFTTLFLPKQFQKDPPDAGLTLTATPHNLGLL